MCSIFRLPGKAFARREHVWLSKANGVDSKTFSRAILAKVYYFKARLYCILFKNTSCDYFLSGADRLLSIRPFET